MSTRLTTAIREKIVADLLRHRFEKAVAEHRDDMAALANAVYDDLYSEADRVLLDSMPEDWMPETGSLGVTFAGSYTHVHFGGYLKGEMAAISSFEAVYRRVASKHNSGCVKTYEARHKLAIRAEKLSAQREGLKEKISEAKRAAISALASVTTVKRLIEGWPEIAPFAAKYEGEKPALPALPTNILNDILDLPVSQAA